jgi:phosphomannomutase
MSAANPSIFRAYDVRGQYPDEINEQTVYAIAQAYVKLFRPKNMVLARDVRLSGPALWSAAAKGFTDHGVDVIDVGVVTTEMMYFAVSAYEYDGGMIVSASHNPVQYNGTKFMRKGGITVSGDTGIYEIRDLVLGGYRYVAEKKGSITTRDVSDDYLAKCLSFVDPKQIKNMRVVVNGMFGPVIKNVERLQLPIETIKLNAEPDGNFPKGPPDPLLVENRAETSELIKQSRADFGAAWDGDADRFFLFDENGRFIPGQFLTALLATYFLKNSPGSTIVHEPRFVWTIQDAVALGGGHTAMERAGHTLIKERMRKEDAVFGGEMSGHYYFRDFNYADSGLIPFLLMLQIYSESDKKFSELFEPYFQKYFCSEETNFPLEQTGDAVRIFAAIEKKYPDAKISKLDGISIEYPDWRANIRASNTQPLLRLCIEAKTAVLRDKKFSELIALIQE